MSGCLFFFFVTENSFTRTNMRYTKQNTVEERRRKKGRGEKSKGVYKCDLWVEGSPLLARGSPDQNTNRVRAWLAKRVTE